MDDAFESSPFVNGSWGHMGDIGLGTKYIFPSVYYAKCPSVRFLYQHKEAMRYLS
jgi:hypothetical protein